MKRLFIALAILAGIGTPAFSQSATEVPSLINYQATLTDANGDLLEDGTSYEIEFRVWDATTGGNLIWGTAYTVTVLGGRLNVMLGATGGTPIAGAAVSDIAFAFTEENRYLGITITKDTDGVAIAGATEVFPRQQVISAPYALSAKNGVPRGSILPYAGSTPPAGWLLCDGSQQDTATYPELSALLGVTWGSAAANKFKLPDLRGLTLIGAGTGAAVSGLSARTLGNYLGEERHTLTIDEMPSHNHTLSDYYHDVGDYDVIEDCGGCGNDLPQGSVDAHDRTTNSTGGGQAHNNMQPSAVVNYIIKF
ncbi:MAG: tail fiber protein [Candidatus Hydrogenedentes bacterium]|nr:tail fiber protein [Candidatus Hydrogenedentota bacterium]